MPFYRVLKVVSIIPNTPTSYVESFTSIIHSPSAMEGVFTFITNLLSYLEISPMDPPL